MDFDAIFIAGPQGSGKGTQGKRLAEKLGFLFWEMGKVLREVSQEDSTLGRRVKLMNQGVLLPDEVIFAVINERLTTMTDPKGIVFDGIPRRLGQAQMLVELLKKENKNKIATVVINLDREECVKRLLLRGKHEDRTDDTQEIIDVRFRYYDLEMKPALEYLKTTTTYIEIDGSPAPEEVEKKIDEALGLGAPVAHA